MRTPTAAHATDAPTRKAAIRGEPTGTRRRSVVGVHVATLGALAAVPVDDM
jgi:hypothetical protein